ncbi:transcriptional regulator family: GATA type zinc finger, partial [Penicillium cf. griseofulvum]
RDLLDTHCFPSIRSRAGFQSTPTSPSTVASTLYRASPIDPALKSRASQEREFPYDLSADSSSARHASNGSIPFSTTLPDIKSVTKFGSGESDGYPGSSVSTSLPGLAALASVASAPTSNLRPKWKLPIDLWIYLCVIFNRALESSNLAPHKNLNQLANPYISPLFLDHPVMQV